MKNAVTRVGPTVAVLALVLGGTAKADLTLKSGEDSGISLTNNDYGSTGKYYDAEVGHPVSRSHPGGGPVAILAVINADMTITLYTDSKAGPYDNAEDTQIGVLNKSGTSLLSFQVNGPNGTYGFDGDGINKYTSLANNSHDNSDGGYGGPLAYFTNINHNGSSGIVNFAGGLAAGSETYFSLELDPTTLTQGGFGVTLSPEPATIVSAGIAGLIGLGYAGYRKKVKSAA